MKEFKFTNFLWLGLALTFPFFTHEYVRYVSGSIKLAIPMFYIGFLLLLNLFLIFKTKGKLPDPFHKMGYLFSFILFAFLVWHVLSLVFFDANPSQLTHIIKIVIGYALMLGVVLFFPKDKAFIEKFWCVTIWASAISMGVFLYRSYFIFHSPFLMNNWEYITRSGRNQLTWYLAFILPIAIASLWDSRKFFINFIPILILAVSLFYAGSRSAVVSVACGVLTIIFTKIIQESGKSIAKNLAAVVLLGLLGIGSWFLIIENVDDPEMATRFQTMAPGNVSHLKEDDRWGLLQRGLKQFSSSPFVGIGLGNASTLNSTDSRDSHNDFLKLLTELGMPGFALFLLIILCVFLRLWPPKINESGQIPWVFVGGWGATVSVIVSLLFINAYEVPLFWIFLGLVFVGREIEIDSWNRKPLDEAPSSANGFTQLKVSRGRPF